MDKGTHCPMLGLGLIVAVCWGIGMLAFAVISSAK